MTNNRGSYYPHSSMKEVEQLTQNHQTFIVYLARNDCPSCQQTDKRLVKGDGKLKENVYRIELNTEKEQVKLQRFLKQHEVKTVPSFIQFDKKMKIKHLNSDYVLGVSKG
ncbi:hypothetical protein RV02_GL002387 [Enterococcus gilvus]|nr:hypothetical protein RV02_GL002387 [Enterococcus gilvus]